MYIFEVNNKEYATVFEAFMNANNATVYVRLATSRQKYTVLKA